jgi:hypothetical protein
MKKLLLLFAFQVLFTASTMAQLLPSIGLNSLPSDNDSICPIPVYAGSFYTSGFEAGDPVPDFTLFDLNGDSVNLGAALQSGKPVLLIAGSYTCPVFRGKINDINIIDSLYGSLLNVYVVYTADAHPIVDGSPYSGTVWVPSANFSEGVLYEQPKTYGERKELIDSMLLNYSINVPILIDGPCNEWWLNYGPAPNNAYLINTNGTVYTKQGWFDRAPESMYCSIDSLLGVSFGYCNTYGNNGNFNFTLDGDSMEYGLPTETLAIHATLENISATDNVVIDIIKRVINTPNGWQTALCADICYAPLIDSIRITIPPLGTQPFTFYFYTGATPEDGDVNVVFKNAHANSNNKFRQGFYGFTNAVGLYESEMSSEEMVLYPNPSHTSLSILNTPGISSFHIIDFAGHVVKTGVAIAGEIDISKLSAGIYLLVANYGDQKRSSVFVKN